MSDVPGWTGRSRSTVPGRRQFLRAAAAGTAGAVAWSVTACEPSQVPPPRPRLIPFGTGWLFGPATAGSSQPGFDDSGLQPVTLPHTVTRLSWREWNPDSWEGVWVYRKHFDAPGGTAGMRVFLDVAGAMTRTTVSLNGRHLPSHTGGYLPFSAEITDRLARRGNVLAITLNSRFNHNVPPDRPPPYAPGSVDFWQPGGLYREVQLRVVPQMFLADVFAKPVSVLADADRHVVVRCTVDAAVVPRGSVTILVQLRDGAREVSSVTVPVKITKRGRVTVTGTLSGLAGITLWDIDDPKLYTVLATLQVGGAPLHDYQVRIGFREASFQLDGFFLNGRQVKLFGVNRHQFYPFAGGAMPARVQRKDAEILRRELNCNMVRCSHYPQSEDFYNACDELGLMVWEEIPGWGYFGDARWRAAAHRDVGDMIIRDRNHPSIIVWGVMPNEAGEHVREYTDYHELARSLDDSRPTGGDGSRTDASYVFDVYSIHDYRHRIGPGGLRQPELWPATDAAGRPYLVCEAVGTLSGPARHYRRTDSQNIQQGQAAAHARVHDIAASDDRYCGLLAWSGYDYNSGHGSQLGGIKYTGVLDVFRIPKPGAAIYQSQLDPKIRPVIQPAFYWDFGPTSPVTSLSSAMICANVDRLEIYVGGAHHATATPDTAHYGHLRYPPSFADFTGVNAAAHPELRIDGYLGSVQVVSRRFSSDPAGDWLLLAADDAELTGDGADATRVVFRAVDAYGAPRPYASAQVRLSVHGPATLVGDNPFDFASAGGAGAAWVRTLPSSAGSVTVRASHPVLRSAPVTIRIRQP